MIEKIELTDMCMVYDQDKVLVQYRSKSWKGWAFPGGHIEMNESFIDSTIREVKEETNLDVSNLELCGLKQWNDNGVRHIVILYKTNSFCGELKLSDEGEMRWVKLSDLYNMELAHTFREMLDVFTDYAKSELILERRDDGSDWNGIIK